MDQELLEYLDERFGEIRSQFDTVNQRLVSVERRLESHDEAFISIDQRFTSMDERFTSINERFSSMNERFTSMNERFISLDERFTSLDQRFDELKRYTGVLVEGLRHEVHLLADSLGTHIEAEHSRHQAIQEQFRETRALIHLSYEQLRQRVQDLERRNQN